MAVVTLSALAPVVTAVVDVDVAHRSFLGTVWEGSKILDSGTRMFLSEDTVLVVSGLVAYVHTFANDTVAEIVFDLA